MSLLDIFRPRITAGAVLVIAVPLTICAAAGVTLAVVAVRRDRPLRQLLKSARKSLDKSIELATETDLRRAQIDALIGDFVDLRSITAKARSVVQRAEDRTKDGTEKPELPAPPEPSPEGAELATPAMDRRARERAAEGAANGATPQPRSDS